MNKKIAFVLVSLTLLASMICIVHMNYVRAQSVVVVSSTGFLDYGTYRIVGEMQNTGSDWAVAEVAASLSDASGNSLGMIYGNPDLNTIPPGGKCPFEADEITSSVASQIASYSLSLTPSVTSSVPMSLQITSNSLGTASNGIDQITGQIINTNSSTATDPTIYVTFYDSNGKVVDEGLAYPKVNGGVLAGGTSASFVVGPQDSTRQSLFASYTLIAESNEYLSEPVSSSISSSSTVAPTSSAALTSTPVTPEFPPVAIALLLLAMLLISATMITAKKRKMIKR